MFPNSIFRSDLGPQVRVHAEPGRLSAKQDADVIDAVVVTVAIRQHAIILKSDPDDIKQLVRAFGYEVAVVVV